MNGRPRALVVDDDAAVRNTIARVLRAEIEVVHAADGDAGSRAVRETKDIDMFFFDVAMPGSKNGLDLLLEAVEHRPLVPRAIVSATLEPATINTALLHDAEFVAKPFELAALRHVVARMLARMALGRDVSELITTLSVLWRLTPAEGRVFTLRASGKREAEACAELGIASSTHQTRVRAILAKAAIAGDAFRDMGALVEALLRGELRARSRV